MYEILHFCIFAFSDFHKSKHLLLTQPVFYAVKIERGVKIEFYKRGREVEYKTRTRPTIMVFQKLTDPLCLQTICPRDVTSDSETIPTAYKRCVANIDLPNYSSCLKTDSNCL